MRHCAHWKRSSFFLEKKTETKELLPLKEGGKILGAAALLLLHCYNPDCGCVMFISIRRGGSFLGRQVFGEGS